MMTSERPRNLVLALFCCLLAALICSTTDAQAQAVKATATKLAIQVQQTPQYTFRGAKDKKVNSRSWIEIEVPYKLDVKPKPKDGYVDSITLKYYVAVDGSQKEVQTGSVTYKNVPVGETLYGVMYIPPDAIERLAKGKKASTGLVKAAVEIEHNGKMVGFAATGLNKGVWRKMEAVEGNLLAKSKTPFAMAFIDRYPSESL